MIRHNNLYDKICDLKNLILADKKARLGKKHQDGVKFFDKKYYFNILKLRSELRNKTYRTSAYEIFYIKEPKIRKVFKLPYKDRIVHHAIMNILEPIFFKTFTADTYSCIKTRGIHKAVIKLKKTLLDKENTTYCLKLDIRKFYPSCVHSILKKILRTKFKDKNLLWLMDEIIDSVNSTVNAEGGGANSVLASRLATT